MTATLPRPSLLLPLSAPPLTRCLWLCGVLLGLPPLACRLAVSSRFAPALSPALSPAITLRAPRRGPAPCRQRPGSISCQAAILVLFAPKTMPISSRPKSGAILHAKRACWRPAPRPQGRGPQTRRFARHPARRGFMRHPDPQNPRLIWRLPSCPQASAIPSSPSMWPTCTRPTSSAAASCAARFASRPALPAPPPCSRKTARARPERRPATATCP